MHNPYKQHFVEWLEKQIAACPPGTRLPSTEALAKKFSISVRTIRRLFSQYTKKGMIQTIKGKGSFVAPVEPDDNQHIGTTSVQEDIREYILNSIRNGTLRLGDPLPSIKFMAMHFSVTPATIIKAYKALIAMQFAVKIGKSFRLTNPAASLDKPAGKTIYLMLQKSDDFSRLFNNKDDLFLGNDIDLIYHKLERELLANGYDVQFENTAQLEQLLGMWASQANIPQGLLFHNIHHAGLEALQPAIARISRSKLLSKMHILFDIASADISSIPASMAVFARGNMFTSVCRTLAQYLILKGYRHATYYFDERSMNIRWFSKYIRIRNELSALDSGFKFSIVMRPKRVCANKEEFVSHILKSFEPGGLEKRISKFGFTSPQSLFKELTITDDMGSTFYRKNNKKVNIFLSHKEALRALKWARNHGRRIPQDYGIVCFENTPELVHERISSCVADWERIGYLLAHKLIGDFSIERTRKGFIRAHSLILDRGSI